MNILVTGSTGFIGRATMAHLQGKGHRLAAWVRDKERARNLLGQGVRLIGASHDPDLLRNELEWSDAVIHLAGKPLAGVRWSEKKKIAFEASRVGLANSLSTQIGKCSSPPGTFISASAVGIYGNRDKELLDETSSLGEGFLAELCSKWEQAALKAQEHGTRVCTLRIGIVLGREGGILEKLVPGFELGIGGYIGRGTQAVPWIHLADTVRAIEFCLEEQGMNGPINLTSPFPVTTKDFAQTLARITGSSVVAPIPRLVLRMLLGEGESVLTNSQHAVPGRLISAGFTYIYKSLERALEDEVRPKSIEIKLVKEQSTTRSTLSGSAHSQFELKTSVRVESPAETTFSFFSSPLNLGLLTPSWVGFRILEIPPKMNDGSKIKYRINLGPFPLRWTTVIVKWQPSKIFVDFQEKGPYKSWWHEHRILNAGPEASVMADKVTYSLPAGILGRIMHSIVIKRALVRIFHYRRLIIQLRFG